MDVLFTFPRKNPKYNTVSELRKTCQYLNISYTKQMKKQELITLLTPFYHKYNYDTIQQRIEIQVQNKSYYVPTKHHYWKSFIKTNETKRYEKYILTSFDGRSSRLCEYDKYKKQWYFSTNYKVQENHEIALPNTRVEIDRIRSIMLYFELQHIYTMGLYLLQTNLLIPDVFYHLIHYYKSYLMLPSITYTVL